MNLNRRYIQFNDLVIDTYEMLDSASYSVSTKTSGQSYSYANGDYVVYNQETQLTEAANLSMTLKLSTKKLSCEQVRYYKDYMLYQLIKVGRLWAIQGDRLLWAWAHVASYSEDVTTAEDSILVDVNFVIPQGNWYKADVMKVFLRPYEPCDFLECEDWRNIPECRDLCGAHCPNCHMTGTSTCDVCNCGCEIAETDLPLCAAEDKLEDFYKMCGNNYRILYDCKEGEKLYGEQMLGQKFCKKEICQSIISGMIYSDSLQETDDLTITIIGKFKNPYLTINGNGMFIDGEYDGIMTIKPNYEVYFRKDEECCEDYLLDQDLVRIPDGSYYGFDLHHGHNPFVLEVNECCSMSCIYFKIITTTI